MAQNLPLLSILASLFMCGCIDSTSSASNSNRKPLSIKSKWHAGGNLHKKTLKEWEEASPENRLATAADFTTTLTGKVDKKLSIELETCISKTTEGLDPKLMSQKVAEIGGACGKLMGYSK